MDKKQYKNNPILYIVVPCYNEEEGIKENSLILLNKLNELIKKKVVARNSKVLFVNDGSNDNTETILNKLVDKNKEFALLSFVTNAGHQNAVFAGMIEAKKYADIVITIDADLQQDVNSMKEFIDLYKQGNDVVYGVRNDRATDGAFKKFSASLYYKLMKLLGYNVLENSADYRLLSKKALNSLEMYKETNLFLRGLIPHMGFKSDIVYFDVKDRTQGKSKYTFKKMLNLAISGLTSFSTTPMHLICLLGGLLVALSFVLLIVFLIQLICSIPFTSIKAILLLVLFLNGITIGCVGLVGEYVGTTNDQVKYRPRYIVDYVKFNKK